MAINSAGMNYYPESFPNILFARMKNDQILYDNIATVEIIPDGFPSITRRAQRFHGGARVRTSRASNGDYSTETMPFDGKTDLGQKIDINKDIDRAIKFSTINDVSWANKAEVMRNQIRASQMATEMVSATQGLSLIEAFNSETGALAGEDLSIDTSSDVDVKSNVVNLLSQTRNDLDMVADRPLKGKRISLFSTPAVVSLLQRYALVQGGTDMENKQMSNGWSQVMNNTQVNSSNDCPLKATITFGTVVDGTEWQLSRVHPFRIKFVASLTGAVNEVLIGNSATATATNTKNFLLQNYGKSATTGTTHGRMSNISASNLTDVNKNVGYTVFRDGNLTFSDVSSSGAVLSFTVFGIGMFWGDTQPYKDGTKKAKNTAGADIATITLTKIEHGVMFALAPIVSVYYSTKFMYTVANSQIVEDVADLGEAYLHDKLEMMSTRLGVGVWADRRHNATHQFITFT